MTARGSLELTDPADDVQPAFSPDGKQIVFVSTRESTTHVIYENFGVPPTGRSEEHTSELQSP